MYAFAGSFGYSLGAPNPTIQRLQSALNDLASATGDRSLAVKVDGAVGPTTVAAFNRAMTQWVRRAEVKAHFKTGRVSKAQIEVPSFATSAGIAIKLEASERRKGKAPAVAATASRPAAPKPPPTKAPKAGAKAPEPARATSSGDVRRLQLATAALGRRVGNATLSAVKADGKMGPKTAAGANLALQRYAPNAAPAMRTGKLPQAQVAAQATAIAMLLEAAAQGAPAASPATAAATAAAPTVRDLQASVVSLGKRTGDKALAITADGKMGPKTAAAVNRALTKYAAGAPAALRTGRLTQVQIVAQAGVIRSAIEQAQGTVPLGPALPPTTPGVIKELQAAVVALGKVTGDRGLAIAADGKMGPKTAAAVNIALSKWAQDAPAGMRTGKLSQAQIVAQATLIKGVILTELQRKRDAQPFGPEPPPMATTGNFVKDLQLAIAALGKVMSDRALAIKADGKIGPATTKAANTALVKYARQAPARLKTGKLTVVDVRNQAGPITKLINDEIGSRGASPAAAAAVAAQEALPPAEAAAVVQQTPGGMPEDLPMIPPGGGAPVPTTIPGPTPSILAPEAPMPGGGGGGGYVPSGGGGGGLMPSAEAPPPAAPGEEGAPPAEAPPPAGFPWKLVLIGAGATLLAGGLVYAFTRKSKPAPAPRAQRPILIPAPAPARAA